MHAERTSVIIADLGYGDAGKGAVTDNRVRALGAHTVIRYNGGAQAAHNVVTPDGRQHVFSQFGAGTFVPGVRTHLSRFMLVQPHALLEEARVLADVGVTDALDRLTIDRDALLISPFQRAANRLKELMRADGRHGSCGMGIGETAADALQLGTSALRVGDLLDPPVLRRKAHLIAVRKYHQVRGLMDELRGLPAAAPEIAVFEDRGFVTAWTDDLRACTDRIRIVDGDRLGTFLREPGTVVFEGAQGVLLDEWRGFHPFTTWSTCTPENALTLLQEHAYDGRVKRMGVLRAYATRHGPGPFVTEDRELSRRLPDAFNVRSDWQRSFRVGWLDAVAARYAAQACGGIHSLSVSCLDRLRGWPVWRLCSAYRLHQAEGAERFFTLKPGDPSCATNIRLGPARDLEYQAALTEWLLRAQPIYDVTSAAPGCDARSDAHLQAIATALGIPVRTAGFGPSSADRRDVRFDP